MNITIWTSLIVFVAIIALLCFWEKMCEILAMIWRKATNFHQTRLAAYRKAMFLLREKMQKTGTMLFISAILQFAPCGVIISFNKQTHMQFFYGWHGLMPQHLTNRLLVGPNVAVQMVVFDLIGNQTIQRTGD